MTKVTNSSQRDDWETPQQLYDDLDDIFNFKTDLAATMKNAKTHFIRDALTCDWSELEGWSWCNPPYRRGKGGHRDFVQHALKYPSDVVFLLPARLDKWFIKDVLPNGSVLVFPNRLRFELDGKPLDSATFPSCLWIPRKKRSIQADFELDELRLIYAKEHGLKEIVEA